MTTFQNYESEVSSYWRHFPCTFSKAKMSKLYDVENREYLDFFCGAGALNYGHNNDYIMGKIIGYLQSGGVVHALDMHTEAKENFIDAFVHKILVPRGMDYKLMFCSPSGTNANEAALKICRKVTGRQNVFSFMGAFHGMTTGSLALTSSSFARSGAGQTLSNVTFFPYPNNVEFDTIAYMESVLQDDHSGIEKPAAIIVETVQAEGGVYVAPADWLVRLRDLCNRYGILLICDEIQVGCCRTGTFFSFERANIQPDLVTLSKSISGSGMPMAIVLLRREYDVFLPGQHNGTFRGFQPAFVGAAAALDLIDDSFLAGIKRKEQLISEYVNSKIVPIDDAIAHRGIGLIHGIDLSKTAAFHQGELTEKIQQECFEKGLIIETAGRGDSVMKIMPALTIGEGELLAGLEILRDAIESVLKA